MGISYSDFIEISLRSLGDHLKMMKHLATVDKAVIAASIVGVGLAIAITGGGFLLGRWVYTTPNLALEQLASREAVARSAPAAVGTLAVAPAVKKQRAPFP